MPYNRYFVNSDPEAMRQAWGNNPFYNPYSKYPDFAGGIRSVLNNIWMMQQQKQQMEQARTQQEWENAYRERALAQQWQEAELQYGNRPQPTPPKTVEQIEAEAEARARGTAKGTAAGTPPRPQKPAMTSYQEAQVQQHKDDIERSYMKALADINSKWDGKIAKLTDDFDNKVAGLVYEIGDKEPTLAQLELRKLYSQQRQRTLQLYEKLRKQEMDNLDVAYGRKKKTPASPSPQANQKDQYGFTLGEVRVSPKDKKPYRYIGNNRWQMVSK